MTDVRHQQLFDTLMGELMESGGVDSDSDVEFVSSTVKPSNGLSNKTGLVVVEKVNGSLLNEKDKCGLDETYYKGLNSYVCEGCDRRFFLLSLFIQHICRITSYTAFNCLDCGTKLTFSNMCRLKRHINEHRRYNNKLNKASMDDMVVELPDLDDFQKVFLYNFKDNSKLMEKTERERSGKCSECSAEVDCLKEHFLSQNIFHGCRFCDLFLPSKCSLEAHVRLHKQKAPFTCPDCGKVYITFTGLNHHLLTECLHHYKCVRYKCPHCFKFSPNKIDKLQDHLRGHCSTIFDCTVCNSSFEEISELRAHLKTHEDKPPPNIIHRCHMCSETLNAREMDIHLKKHIVNEVTIYCFVCLNCGAQMYNLTTFRDHVEKHRHYKMPFWKQPSVVLMDYPPKELAEKIEPVMMKIDPKVMKVDVPNSERTEPVVMKTEPFMMKVDLPKLEKPPQPGPSTKLIPRNSCRFCFGPVEKSSIHLKACKACHINTVSCRCALCGMTLRKVNSIIEYHLMNVHQIKAKKDFSGYLVGPRRPAPVSSNSTEPTKKAKTDSSDPDDVSDPSESSSDPLACRYCAVVASSKEELRAHYPSHREDSQFQCLDCGECFVSRSSLSIHLVSVHSLADPESYMSSNDIHTLPQKEPSPPLKENQCSECHAEFPDAKSLQFHFRSHGLAFLRQNVYKKPQPTPSTSTHEDLCKKPLNPPLSSSHEELVSEKPEFSLPSPKDEHVSEKLEPSPSTHKDNANIQHPSPIILIDESED